MIGLVLEGGSFRAIYSAGVMDALLAHDIYLPYCIGASAGISNGVSYISKQPERNLRVFKNYRNDKRYISRMNLIKNRSIFGLDFVFNQVPNELEKFDWETYQKYKGRVVVVTTDALTGKPHYFNGLKMDRNCQMLRATCALPLAFPAIMIKGTPYYDGGLSDPIPIRKAIEDGCEKNIIVLTRPKGYIKECSGQGRVIAKCYRHKYPKIAECILNRHIGYNETVKYCEQLEAEGKAIILRPEEPLDSFEKDEAKIQAGYDMGYAMAEREIERIKSFIM